MGVEEYKKQQAEYMKEYRAKKKASKAHDKAKAINKFCAKLPILKINKKSKISKTGKIKAIPPAVGVNCLL